MRPSPPHFPSQSRFPSHLPEALPSGLVCLPSPTSQGAGCLRDGRHSLGGGWCPLAPAVRTAGRGPWARPSPAGPRWPPASGEGGLPRAGSGHSVHLSPHTGGTDPACPWGRTAGLCACHTRRCPGRCSRPSLWYAHPSVLSGARAPQAQRMELLATEGNWSLCPQSLPGQRAEAYRSPGVP